jgi:transposase-like protein
MKKLFCLLIVGAKKLCYALISLCERSIWASESPTKCPFCGSAEHVKVGSGSVDEKDFVFKVCDNCLQQYVDEERRKRWTYTKRSP